MLRAMVEESKVIFVSKPFVLGICNCGCKEEIPIKSKSWEVQRYKYGHNNTKERHWKYKQGRRKNNKYIMISNKDHKFADSRGYVREHRLVYEEYYKCCLLPWIDIHHIDNNPKNNIPTNLQPILNPDHTRLHHKKDMSDRFCLICHSKTTFKSKKKPQHNYAPKWYKFRIGFMCGSCYNKIRRNNMCLL